MNDTYKWEEPQHYHGRHTDNWYQYDGQYGPTRSDEILWEFDKYYDDEYRFLLHAEMSAEMCHPAINIQFLPGMGEYGKRMLFEPGKELSCDNTPQGINEFLTYNIEYKYRTSS